MAMRGRKPMVAVIGGSAVEPDIAQIAREVGREIARRGGVLITGGLGGVMEAASRGAREAGGLVVGILPGLTAAEANAYVDLPIVTGMADARNTIIARTADVVIAVDGELGTLSEIAFSLKFGKPVVGIRTWEVHPQIHHCDTAQQAVARAFELIKEK